MQEEDEVEQARDCPKHHTHLALVRGPDLARGQLREAIGPDRRYRQLDKAAEAGDTEEEGEEMSTDRQAKQPRLQIGLQHSDGSAHAFVVQELRAGVIAGHQLHALQVTQPGEGHHVLVPSFLVEAGADP
eukprot:906745-Rhodomonas_salina.1